MSECDSPTRVELLVGHLKHLATLSTSAVFVEVTLLDDLFTDPVWLELGVLSIVGFLVATGAATGTYSLALLRPQGHGRVVGGLGVVVALLSFNFALAALTVFAARNLLLD